MSLKQEIETWVQALGHYDNNEFEEALRVFDNISDTSKILFNCGVIHATLGEHERAVECYQRAIHLDQYLAVAYFQQGVSNFLVGDFEEALANFNDTLLYLRGNTYIDYEQLGLKFRLYSCEVLFNRGLCYVYLQQDGAGMQDFSYAIKEKMTPDHDVIDDAIREKAEGYTVFSIPVGVIYRPNEAKVKNLKTKDYLGKARLVAAAAGSTTSTGFAGADKKQALAAENAPKDDRSPDKISFAATNLVQRNLSSRAPREQSAPATMNRNVFPPTPPPESDKPRGTTPVPAPTLAMTGRANSVRNPPSRPFAQQKQNDEAQPSDPRMERPGMLSRSNTIDAYRSASPSQMASVDRSNTMGAYRTASPNGPVGIERSNTMDAYGIASPNRTAGVDRSDLWSPPRQEKPRMAPARTASESRVPQMRRQYTERRPPLFRETTPQRQFEPIHEDHVYEDVYDMYTTRSSRGSGRSGSRQPAFNGEPRLSNGSDDTMPEAYEEDEFAGDDRVQFDMMSGAPNLNANMNARRPNLPVRSTSRRKAQDPIRSVRVKVHANEDTRYMMFGSMIEYGDFEGKIREKFAIKSKLKIRMQDEGDMITMGDQDDLDMLLSAAKELAKKEASEMAKMEVWIQEM